MKEETPEEKTITKFINETLVIDNRRSIPICVKRISEYIQIQIDAAVSRANRDSFKSNKHLLK